DDALAASQMRVEIAERQAPQVVDELLHVQATRLHSKVMLERQRRRACRAAFPVGRQREDHFAVHSVEWPLKTEQAIALEPRDLRSRIRSGRRTVSVPSPERE